LSPPHKSVAPNSAKGCAHYEPLAWWLARERIGKDLRERYAVPDELPACMLMLVKKLDDPEAN
jgi:hypothetical protein